MNPLILAQAQNNTPYIQLSRLSEIPNPLEAVAAEIMALAYVITVAGFILHFYQHKDSPEPGYGTLLRAAIVTACIAMLPMLRELATDVFYYFPLKLLEDGAGVNGAGDRIRQLLSDSYDHNQGAALNFWNIGFASLMGFILATILNAIGFVGSLIVIPFYFIQRFGELIGFALMPIALACMTIPALADKATNFVMSVLSILAWPFGFVLSSMCASSVLDIAINEPLPSGWGFLGAALVPFLAAAVLIVGTTSTPLLAYFVFTTGGGYLPTPSAGQLASPLRTGGAAVSAIGRAAR